MLIGVNSRFGGAPETEPGPSGVEDEFMRSPLRWR
jgi:hypothetical protein